MREPGVLTFAVNGGCDADDSPGDCDRDFPYHPARRTAFDVSAQALGSPDHHHCPLLARHRPGHPGAPDRRGIQQRWGQPVAVDNKPGATATSGTQIAARAAPDGHTLLMTTNPITANISLFKNVPYDPVKSFAPVIFVGTGALALAVHPSIPAASFTEFLDYVRARPGQINFGSPASAARIIWPWSCSS